MAYCKLSMSQFVPKSRSSIECKPRNPSWASVTTTTSCDWSMKFSYRNYHHCLHWSCWTQDFSTRLRSSPCSEAHNEHYVTLENKDHVCNVEIILLDLHIHEASSSKKKRMKVRDAIDRGITMNQIRRCKESLLKLDINSLGICVFTNIWPMRGRIARQIVGVQNMGCSELVTLPMISLSIRSLIVRQAS